MLLEFLEEKGVDAPFSCREGKCSACACVVLEGEVTLKHNEVLDAEDLADGIRLVCQSLPAEREAEDHVQRLSSRAGRTSYETGATRPNV